MSILAITIIILGSINVLRMAIFFILSDLYDMQLASSHIATGQKSAKRHPKFSIIVAAHNEAKVIERTLQSLQHIQYSNFEVIVVDDGSTDHTSFVVRSFIKQNKTKNFFLLKQKNHGKAHALNQAITKKAKGKFIMSLDADSIVAPDILARALTYFQDKKIVGIASNVRIINTNSFMGLMQTIEYLMGHRLKKAFSVANMEYVIGGIGAIFRRDILFQVGLYDTDTVTEDIDLTLKIINRLGNTDHLVLFAPDVLCFTEAPMTFKGLFRQRFRWKYGRFQSLFKNRSLFFNFSSKYSKLLTLFYLPFILFSELTFLLDPLFLIFIFYISIVTRSTDSIVATFVFYGFYSLLTILTDEHFRFSDKIILSLVSPIAYVFFSIISFVEYLGLIFSLLNLRGIFGNKKLTGKWEHVERVG